MALRSFGRVISAGMGGGAQDAASLLSLLTNATNAANARVRANPFGGVLGAALGLGGESSSAPAQGSTPAPTGNGVASPMGTLPSLTGSAVRAENAGVGMGDTAATDLPPYARAFLNAVSVGESRGKYNVRYSPQGGATYEGNNHPAIYEPGPSGPSSAAGRYQITNSTYKAMGGGDFSPAAQDVMAWNLAQKDYKARTGRDLSSDLQAGGMTPGIMKSLSPTWTSFGSEKVRGEATSEYNNSLARYSQGNAPAPAPVSPPMDLPAPVAQAAKGVGGDPVGSLVENGTLGPLYNAVKDSLVPQKGDAVRATDDTDKLLNMLRNMAPPSKTWYNPPNPDTGPTGIFDKPNSIDGPMEAAIALGDRFSTDGMRRSTNVEDMRNLPFPIVDDNGVPLGTGSLKNSDWEALYGGIKQTDRQQEDEAKSGAYTAMGKPFNDALDAFVKRVMTDETLTQAAREDAIGQLIKKMKERDNRSKLPTDDVGFPRAASKADNNAPEVGRGGGNLGGGGSGTATYSFPTRFENAATEWARGNMSAKDFRELVRKEGWTIDGNELQKSRSSTITVYDPSGREHRLQP